MARILKLDCSVGSFIITVCKEALALANAKQCQVEFTFNDVRVLVSPGESPHNVQKRWDNDREAAHQALINSPEYKARQKKATTDLKARRDAHMVESAQTEAELRDTKDPWPLTKEQLIEYIESLIHRGHDYGTCCYAMSLAATAAFNYVAGVLGSTGFQASCADLDFLRRSRSIKGPFILLKGEDALFPQYDLREKLEEALTEWSLWLKQEAQKKLKHAEGAHPDAVAHWRKLTAR